MTALFTDTPYFGDICEEIRLFVDTRRIDRLAEQKPLAQGCSVIHSLKESCGVVTSDARVYLDGKPSAENVYTCASGGEELIRKREEKRAAKISVYRALSGLLAVSMPWGSLTGIRPTKLLRDSEERHGERGARALFLNEFDVSEEKYALSKRIIDIQRPLMPDENDIDVYIGIPFCTTRCAYCSFASSTPGVFKDAEQAYVKALLDELSAAERLLEGSRVRSVYVGGGTPTALCEDSLKTVLSRASEIASGADEFTVEAGRPDTITEKKLRIIKDAGAGRVSVNTQTLNESTLERIGRRHTAEEFFAAFCMAREAGFVINTDVIAGLPGETESDVASTLKSVIELSPENVTVHTLAIKRASKFAEDNMESLPGDSETAAMINGARAMLESKGYNPYYMYRQKYMRGSLENAGFAKKGFECLYNIDNMEELCSVAAFGAGAISKRVYGGGERIERSANIKDLRLYVKSADDMIKRKFSLFRRGLQAK